MATPKKYFHDHLVLLLLSINAFLAIANAIFILVRLSTGHGNSFIVQCRDCSDPTAINKFTTGNIIDLLGFVVFLVLVLALHASLSLRAYRINRQVSVAILALGVLLLVLTAIISNALLILR